MIHAYLFITNPESCKVNGGHGKEFTEIMGNINKITKLDIKVYHSFHDEVEEQRKHVWKCDGPCQHQPPYYGLVRRANNRKPQRADPWFEAHTRTCGGHFVKIS